MLTSLDGSTRIVGCRLAVKGFSRCWRKTQCPSPQYCHPKPLHPNLYTLRVCPPETPSNVQRLQWTTASRELQTASAKEPGRTRPWHMHMWSSWKPKTLTGSATTTLRRKRKSDIFINSISCRKQHQVTRPNLTMNPYIPNRPESWNHRGHFTSAGLMPVEGAVILQRTGRIFAHSGITTGETMTSLVGGTCSL